MQENSINPTHRTRQAPNYWIFQLIRQYLHRLKSLWAVFCYCSYCWGCATNQRSIPFGYLLHLLVQVVTV